MRLYMGVQPSPLPCPRGKYRPPGGGITLSECVLCPRGVYGDSPGLTSSDCTAKCPKGSYNDRRGGTSILDCSPCPPGTYGTGAGLTTSACTGPCPYGKYSRRSGLTSVSECIDCPVGYRGASGRRPNRPFHGNEGGYPCDRYSDGGTILTGRDEALLAARDAFLANPRSPKRNFLNNNRPPVDQ